MTSEKEDGIGRERQRLGCNNPDEGGRKNDRVTGR